MNRIIMVLILALCFSGCIQIIFKEEPIFIPPDNQDTYEIVPPDETRTL